MKTTFGLSGQDSWSRYPGPSLVAWKERFMVEGQEIIKLKPWLGEVDLYRMSQVYYILQVQRSSRLDAMVVSSICKLGYK